MSHPNIFVGVWGFRNGEPVFPGGGGGSDPELALKVTRNSITGMDRAVSGVLSVASVTEVDIEAGTGQVIDNTTDAANPTCTPVSWPAQTVTIVDVATADFTLLFIDDTGAVVQQTTADDGSDRRGMIFLGFSTHFSGAVISVTNSGVRSADTSAMVLDLMQALGDLNISGNVYGPNGVNLLLDRTSGTVFGREIDAADVTDPQFLNTSVATAISLYVYNFQDGSGGFDGEIEVTTIPDFYDDGSGTPVAVPANKFTIQRLHMDGRNPAVGIIEYGQETYNTQADAIDGLTENGIVKNVELDRLILRGWMIVQEGTVDLSDTAMAIFLENVGDISQGSGFGQDPNAIHVNVAAEIKGIAENTDPHPDDIVATEDSQDGDNKKRVTRANWNANRMFVSSDTVLVGTILKMANAVGNLPQASALREIGGSLCYALLNATGAAVAVGKSMQVNPALPSTVILATSDTATWAGVCAEAAGALATDLVWMAFGGEAEFECTVGGGTAIAVGDHLDSAGGGLAHTHGFATGNTFAVAVTAKADGASSCRAIVVPNRANGDVRSQLPSISIPNMIPTYPGTDAHVIGISGMFIFLTALCVDLENKSGGTISLGEILKADDGNDNAVVLATAGAQIDAWAGIAMAASVNDGDPVYCGFSGVATVLCDATAVVRGDYIEVGPTAGLGVGFATSGPGSFGVALTAKGAGIGTVQVLMRGMETF